MKSFKSIEAYIRSFPPKIQKELKAIRKTIKKVVPKAGEKMAYGIPTIFLKKNLVHFAAFREHFSFFPGSRAVVKFKKALEKYETSKGTIRFPLDKPIPHGLIRKIVKFNVKQHHAAAKAKARKR